MIRLFNTSINKKQKTPNKLVLGFLVTAITALISLSGTPAYAINMGHRPPGSPNPTTKQDCKNGGWRDYNFKNQGQCIKWVNAHQGGGGYGGGNGNNISNLINLIINGSNNVVNIIINFFFR